LDLAAKKLGALKEARLVDHSPLLDKRIMLLSMNKGNPRVELPLL